MIIIKKILKQIVFFLLPLILLNEMGYISVTDKTKKFFDDELESLKGEIIMKLQSVADKKGPEVKNLVDKKVDQGIKVSEKKIQESSIYLNKKMDERQKF